MIRIGQTEFTIPPWLCAAVPFVFLLYAVLELTRYGFSSYGLMGGNYLSFVRQLAVASIAGLFLIDLLRRSIGTRCQSRMSRAGPRSTCFLAGLMPGLRMC